jgi:hypothetical protein
MSTPMTLTLTPIGGSGNNSWSTVKSLSFFLLFVGIIFITVGYLRSEASSPPPRVEFRYIPRTFEQEQSKPIPVLSIFGKMFSNRDPWQKYKFYEDTFPWERANINSIPVTNYNQIGFGRGVGQRIIG